MHTVELLEQSLALAEQMGYSIRHEWLGGAGGGACEIAGRKWIFIDLALSVVEQLDQVTTAIKDDPAAYIIEMPQSVSVALGLRRAA
jgi:hypothetical protein